MESLPSTRPAIDPRAVAPAQERERRATPERRERASARRATPEPAEPERAAASGDEPGAHLDVTA